MVLRKLKSASPSLSELLDQEILAELLDNLFPRYDMPDPIKDWSNFVWSDVALIQPGEVLQIITKRPISSTKTPGTDLDQSSGSELWTSSLTG